jgi:hypothetical protein
MIEFVVHVGLGALLGAAFVGVARTLSRLEHLLFASGLVVAALAYVAVGITARAPGELALELGGAAGFLALALAGFFGPSSFLAAGWAAHGVWDLMVPSLKDVSYMAKWYVAACLGFDVVVAAYIAAVGRRAINPRPARTSE